MPTNDPPPPPPSTLPISESEGTYIFSTLADIPLPPSVASIDENAKGYLAAGHNVDYSWDSGLRPQVPAAAKDGGLTGFVRVHCGCGSKVVSGAAVRIAVPPEPPHPDTQSANEVLLTQHVGMFSAGKLADGTPMIGVLYTYVYGLQAPPGPGDYLDAGKSQVDTLSMAQYRLNVASFRRDLIAPAAPVSSQFAINPITY